MTPRPSVQPCPLPPHALLAAYADRGAYVDCYTLSVRGSLSLAAHVEAFYTTRLFKVERLLLAWLLSAPSSDAQARQLAAGDTERFAYWRVEGRTADQLLLRDLNGRTRSWFMVASTPLRPGHTQLYFGSAVVPVVGQSEGRASMGFAFKALLGFHQLYSRALLRAAQARHLRASP